MVLWFYDSVICWYQQWWWWWQWEWWQCWYLSHGALNIVLGNKLLSMSWAVGVHPLTSSLYWESRARCFVMSCSQLFRCSQLDYTSRSTTKVMGLCWIDISETDCNLTHRNLVRRNPRQTKNLNLTHTLCFNCYKILLNAPWSNFWGRKGKEAVKYSFYMEQWNLKQL